MKNRTRWFVVGIIAVAGALWFSNSLTAVQKETPRTVVSDNGGIVLTGTDLSKTDEEAMNKILGRYDKSLYRIDTYEKGKRTRSRGTLTDVVTNKKLAAEIAANTKKGLTHYAVQVCSTTNPTQSLQPKPDPTSTPDTVNPISGPTGGSANSKRCRELVDRLKPILEKYRRK